MQWSAGIAPGTYKHTTFVDDLTSKCSYERPRQLSRVGLPNGMYVDYSELVSFDFFPLTSIVYTFVIVRRGQSEERSNQQLFSFPWQPDGKSRCQHLVAGSSTQGRSHMHICQYMYSAFNFSFHKLCLILKDWFLIRFPPNFQERFLMSSASPEFIFWGPKIKQFYFKQV